MKPCLDIRSIPHCRGKPAFTLAQWHVCQIWSFVYLGNNQWNITKFHLLLNENVLNHALANKLKVNFCYLGSVVCWHIDVMLGFLSTLYKLKPLGNTTSTHFHFHFFHMEDLDMVIIYSQYHGCWWPGNRSLSQGISSYCINLVFLEYCGINIKIVVMSTMTKIFVNIICINLLLQFTWSFIS